MVISRDLARTLPSRRTDLTLCIGRKRRHSTDGPSLLQGDARDLVDPADSVGPACLGWVKLIGKKRDFNGSRYKRRSTSERRTATAPILIAPCISGVPPLPRLESLQPISERVPLDRAWRKKKSAVSTLWVPAQGPGPPFPEREVWAGRGPLWLGKPGKTNMGKGGWAGMVWEGAVQIGKRNKGEVFCILTARGFSWADHPPVSRVDGPIETRRFLEASSGRYSWYVLS